MGRYSSNAETTKNSFKLSLSDLKNKGLLKNNSCIQSQLGWFNSEEQIGEITIQANLSLQNQKYIRLIYVLTESKTGNKYKLDYKINLVEVKSNLNKGSVLYFQCPNTGRKCRNLYRAYGSHIWKSRDAYQGKLFYPIQLSSKLDRCNDRYWELDGLLKSKLLRATYMYKGKVTRRAMREEKLMYKHRKLDNLRWSIEYFPVKMRLGIYEYLNSNNP